VPVVSRRLNRLPQLPFQLRLSLIGSKLIRNEPERPIARREEEGGGGEGGGRRRRGRRRLD